MARTLLEQRRPTRCRVERKLVKSNRGVNGYGAGEQNLTPFGRKKENKKKKRRMAVRGRSR